MYGLVELRIPQMHNWHPFAHVAYAWQFFYCIGLGTFTLNIQFLLDCFRLHCTNNTPTINQPQRFKELCARDATCITRLLVGCSRNCATIKDAGCMMMLYTGQLTGV